MPLDRAFPSAAAPVTRHLGVQDMVGLVRRVGLSRCLAEIAARIEADFRRWPEFDLCPRLASHSADGVIELMPAADATRYTVKYVNGHPRNTRDGLPTVMAFGVLADVATGMPRLVSEMTLLTAIRTAAMSALAARHLARPDSRTMALIGNGAQAEFQALAMRDLVGIRTLRLFDIDPAATARLVAHLARFGAGLETVVCADAAEAVRGADIVTTATADKARATILTPDMIAPGMHLNAVGGDCPGKTELHPDVLRAGPVFVEYEPQTRVEGDIQQMPADFPVTEFWRVLAGRAPGRIAPEQVTVFDSVGFAVEDGAALAFVHDTAQAQGLGTVMDLVPRQDDPKDLFGLLVPADAALRRAA